VITSWIYPSLVSLPCCSRLPRYDKSLTFAFKWDDSLPGKRDQLKDMNIMKIGVSSGLTCGCLLEESVNQNYFFVTSCDVCPFAIPGDSGSVVFDWETGNVVGIVIDIRQLEQHNGAYVTRVLPVWEIADHLEEFGLL
jgi:hypothetical protein